MHKRKIVNLNAWFVSFCFLNKPWELNRDYMNKYWRVSYA